MLGDYIVSRPYVYRITTYMGLQGTIPAATRNFAKWPASI